jgi:hypothetical protein
MARIVYYQLNRFVGYLCLNFFFSFFFISAVFHFIPFYLISYDVRISSHDFLFDLSIHLISFFFC